ncbi:MAG TPA: MotA/TolQ/ExbB proton channel family protein [Nostocaceae cyanobacterium]|nr:MotA/TolQ/ExbB proton channel family protein [Nostocaceae cyanobacterium]
MGIGEIWSIVWQNSPFHWATATVLVIATLVEGYTLWQYCRKTKASIKFLANLKKSKNGKPPKSVPSDLQGDFGIDDTKNIRRDKDGKFILKKYPSVLARPIPRSSLRFVTTLCTAIGVLGTFYGIQQGLQEINLNTTTSSELMNSSKQLLEGMKTAFSTSLMGLGSGSIFTLVLFVTDFWRQKRRDSLRHQLNKIATLETADDANQKAAEALSNIADKFQGINQLSAESIGQAVAQQMQSVFLPALQSIYQEQQRLRQLQENQGQRVLQTLIQDLRIHVLEPIAERLDDSARLTQQASDAVSTLHRELGGISQSLADSILTIQNFQRETLVELQQFAHNLGQTLSQFQTDTRGVLEQTSVEINRAVEQSIEGMTAQRSAFESSAEKAAATFRGIREDLQTALAERAEVEKQIFEGVKTGIVQILTQALRTFQQQSNTLETVGNQASGLMNDARTNLIATLENIASTLTATRQTVQDDLTLFRQEYQANLQAFFVEQNNLLEGTLGKQRDGLAKVVINLDQVFQAEATRRSELTKAVDESMRKIQTSVEKINNLVIAAGLNDSQRLIQLTELARGIGEQVQIVDNSYRDLSAQFQYSLNAWQAYLESSMERTIGLQENFFQQADTAMSRVCGDLLETSRVLVAAKESGSNGHV